MTALPPPAPGAPPTIPAPGWAPEALKRDEPAGLRSQAAVYAVCALAIAIVTGATGTFGWGLVAIVALGGGIAISLAGDLARIFRSLPGAVASVVTMLVLVVVMAFVGGSAVGFALVPAFGAFVLGLDWRLVRRLRPLPFASGFLVVAGVSGGETWTYPAGLVWLALALGALASLEADRRAAQPHVVPVNSGPGSTELQKGDLATSVLIALAIALLAALVLSTPSCQRNDSSPKGGGGSAQDPFGQNGTGSGGSGEPGSGQTGSGEPGSGGPGSSSGSGRASDHLYVPDPDGRFLIPNSEAGRNQDRSGDGASVPSPELLPRPGTPSRHYELDDGTKITAELVPPGDGRITVTDPDGTTRTYTYRYRSDGLTEIQERDEDGRAGRTLYYDPEGQLATDDEAAVDQGGQIQPDPADQQEQPEQDEGEQSHLDWRLLLLVVAVLAGLGALIWWLSRRSATPPPPDAPPWAIALAREIERDGAARGPARGRSQSLARYAAALQAGPLPDPRVTEVADVVSTALFSRRDPGPQAQAWAEGTWAEIVAAHPAPGRRDRRRAEARAAELRR